MNPFARYPRRVSARAILALLVAISLAACGSDSGSRAPKTSTITGVVVDVTSPELGRVTRFSLTSEGRVVVIHIDPSVHYDFAPAHLQEHLTSAEPVTVRARRRGGKLYALSIEDA
jgi:hypothetical protein